MNFKSNFLEKIYPIAIIGTLFLFFLIGQMIVNDNYLSASKLSEEQKKTALFEKLYSEVKLKTVQGPEIDLSKVNKPIVILNFWASWCQPCISEFKSLNKLIRKLGEENIFVLGINNDDSNQLKQIKKTHKKYQLRFNSYADKDSELTAKFLVESIPVSIVYYKGKVIKHIPKEFDFDSDDFIKLLKSKINESKG